MAAAPSQVDLDRLGPTHLFITADLQDAASDAKVGDVIITAEPAPNQGTWVLTGVRRVRASVTATTPPAASKQAGSPPPSGQWPTAFIFEHPVLIPVGQIATILGEYAAGGGMTAGDPFQATVATGPQREAVVALVERGAPGFGRWLDPPARLWSFIDPGDGSSGPWLSEGVGHLVQAPTLFEAAPGDYVLFHRSPGEVAPAGVLRLADLGDGGHSTYRIVARLAEPIEFTAIEADPALARWFTANRDGPARDILASPEIWTALTSLLTRHDPALQPFCEAITVQAGSQLLANVLTARMPGYDPDLPAGERDADLLDLQAEYRTLAIMLAARAVKPPLAVGLFGEWGSGKSSFIKQVRREVDQAARLAATEMSRRAEADRATGNVGNIRQSPGKTTEPAVAFHRDIIQIEFNAWHYSEGDLWAGLVDHLFTSLRDQLRARAGADCAQQAERELRALLDELDVQKEVERAANRQMRDLEREESAARDQIATEQRRLVAAETELATARHVDIWDGVSLADVGDDLRARLATAAATHGYPGIATDVHQLVALGRRLGEQGQRSEVLWRTLRRQGLRPWNLALLLGTVLAAMVLGPLLTRLLSTESLLPMLTQILVFVAGVVEWLRRRAQWLSDQMAGVEAFLDQVDTARTRVEAKVRQNEVARTLRVTRAEAQLAHVRNALDAAERARATARQQQIQLISQIEECLPERRMADFIEERANSKDYREKLGIMAVVRRDFERLSELLLSSASGDAILSRARAAVAAAGGSDQVREQAAVPRTLPRIDRIILYIDDLDRCTPQKVVEVLRAVHLLLAFPLFVVVVAVDPRWVSRSLEICHEELLLDSMGPGRYRAAGRTEPPGSQPTRTTAIDYLEKIFQIPYWVPEFSPRASQRMLRGLVAGQLAPPPGSPPGDTGPPPDRAARLAAIDRDLEFRVDLNRRPREVAAQPDLDPEGLLITDTELRHLVRVAPLAGKSPRQVKQFTNLYRLVKVSLGESELRDLFGRNGDAPGSLAVSLLLAAATGAATVAGDLFDRIEGLRADETLVDLLDALEADSPAFRTDRGRALAGLAAQIREVLPPESLSRDDLLGWLPAVRRFTFASGGLG